jgi:acetyltransferase-like isoleucine patch superfamily enzyme
MIHLGENVTIHRNCWIQVVEYRQKTDKHDVHDNQPKLIIKNNVSIGMNSTISAVMKIVIEENVLTAPNVYISDHGHEFKNVTEPITTQGITEPREVTIGANSWLGMNSVILPGVRIGKHCIIGANSVVTRDVPDYSIAAGIPATIIKRYDQATQKWEKV